MDLDFFLDGPINLIIKNNPIKFKLNKIIGFENFGLGKKQIMR